MEYRSTALEIPFVDTIKIYEKRIVCKGCQKMIYPECFVVCKEKLKGKCTCKCKCKKIKWKKGGKGYIAFVLFIVNNSGGDVEKGLIYIWQKRNTIVIYG